MPRVAPNPNFSLPAGLFSLNTDLIIRVVRAAADNVVLKVGDRAFETAFNKVPVRKVFRGGHARTRAMTMGELSRMTPGLLSVMSAAEHRRIEDSHRGGIAAWQSMPRDLQGRRVVVQRNRFAMPFHTMNSKGITVNREDRAAREVTQVLRPNQKNFRIGNYGQAIPTDTAAFGHTGSPGRNLNAAGRYALSHHSFREMSGQEGFDAGDLVDTRHRGLNIISVRDDMGRPTGEHRFLLGGSLQRSLKRTHTDTGDQLTYTITAGGERAPYARFMEFGTRYVAARPFLRPAIKSAEAVFRSRMESELRRALGAGRG